MCNCSMCKYFYVKRILLKLLYFIVLFKVKNFQRSKGMIKIKILSQRNC